MATWREETPLLAWILQRWNSRRLLMLRMSYALTCFWLTQLDSLAARIEHLAGLPRISR